MAEIINTYYHKILFMCRSFLVPVLFPRKCPICGELLPYGMFICTDCERSLPFANEPVCYLCGKPLSDEREEYCYDCSIFRKSFRGGRALFIYDDCTRPLMTDFKYHNDRGLSGFFVSEIVKRHAKAIHRWQVDALVPVPVHKNKKKIRGYNQAELICRDLSTILGIPCYPDLLVRIVDTLPQKELNARDRLFNLTRAFVLNYKKYGIKKKMPRRVMLIDDIYTTGATMEVCTRILKKAEIEVYIFSLCIGISRD